MKDISTNQVHPILTKYMLYAGYNFVLDLQKSGDGFLFDSLSNRKIIDMFSFYGTCPIGFNHPKMLEDKFTERIGKVAVNKPSNFDYYTKELAEFVSTFERVAIPKNFIHLFLIEGGALAVENALKVAFDWKIKKNFNKGYKVEKGTQVIHLKDAFHGRTGYTMSLTNTDPNKIAYFPKFNWPRITNPKLSFPITEQVITNTILDEEKAINEIYKSLNENKDDIACLIMEPIQAEGGDNHFRKEFFIKLREICDENEILLIFDEVQTGIGLTGKMWGYQHFVEPDIIAFGKKMQVCGILTNNRIDDIEDNCFKKPYRINSTWGGNLTDMVRATKYLEIIEEENLVNNAKVNGEYLLNKLFELETEFPNIVSNSRGLGLMCAIDLPDANYRNELKKKIFDNGMIILGCGEKSIRFRPPLNISRNLINEAVDIIKKSIKE